MQRVYNILLRHVKRQRQRCQCELVTFQKPRKAPVGNPSLIDSNTLLLICPLTSFYLAYWQWRRKAWKENLIETIKARYEMEPLELPKDLSELEEFHLYPFKVRGHFDYTNEVYLGPRSEKPDKVPSLAKSNVQGVHVVTPFKLADRELSILVNRGWYDQDYFVKEEYRKKGQVHGEQELVGILRKDQDMSGLVYYFIDLDRADKKDGCDIYCVRKVNKLAERCGTAPVYLDAKYNRKSIHEPRPVKLGVELRNEHFNYSLTWLGLGIITLFLWFKRVSAVRATTVDTFLKRSRK